MDIYPWLVFLHIVGAFTFAIAHGASAFAAFKIRGERDRGRIGALVELSSMGIGVMYIGLLVLLIAGIWAGIIGGWFSKLWIWAAIVILVLVMGAMYAIATRYYIDVRRAVGIQPPQDKEPVPPATDAELATLLDTRRPETLAAIGVVGLGLILYLMVIKPF